MPSAASTYDPDGTLRTVTDSPDVSALNLQRSLINDRRADYDQRRANRGTEKPYAAPPAVRGSGGGTGYVPREPMMAGMDGDEYQLRNARTRAEILQLQAAARAPMPKQAPADMSGLSTGIGYTAADPHTLNAYQRSMYLPGEAKMQGKIPDQDEGWDQFLAMSERRRAVAGRPGAGAGATAPGLA